MRGGAGGAGLKGTSANIRYAATATAHNTSLLGPRGRGDNGLTLHFQPQTQLFLLRLLNATVSRFLSMSPPPTLLSNDWGHLAFFRMANKNCKGPANKAAIY